jgi:hypothetical protein
MRPIGPSSADAHSGGRRARLGVLERLGDPGDVLRAYETTRIFLPSRRLAAVPRQNGRMGPREPRHTIRLCRGVAPKPPGSRENRAACRMMTSAVAPGIDGDRFRFGVDGHTRHGPGSLGQRCIPLSTSCITPGPGCNCRPGEKSGGKINQLLKSPRDLPAPWEALRLPYCPVTVQLPPHRKRCWRSTVVDYTILRHLPER